MSSELQLDVRQLNRWRRHLVTAYEVKASMVFIAGKTVWSIPERLKVVCMPCKALYKCSALPLPLRSAGRGEQDFALRWSHILELAPDNLKNVNLSLQTFKRHLKTFFSSY